MCDSSIMESNSNLMDLHQLGIRDLEDYEPGQLRSLGKLLIEKIKEFSYIGLKNHGIPLSFVKNHHEAAGKFFNLPLEEKMKNKRSLETYQGYTDGTVENLSKKLAGTADSKETFDITDLEEPLPKSVPELITTAAECYRILTPFVQNLLALIEMGMDWPPSTMRSLHSDLQNQVSTLRALKYPPVPEAPLEAIRCGAHKDFSTFTLQFPTDIGGFQVSHNGEWKNADGDPDAIGFFFGETMEYLSGYELTAAPHRVIVTSDELQGNKARLSMTLFVHPDRDKNIQSYSGPKTLPPMRSSELMQSLITPYYK